MATVQASQAARVKLTKDTRMALGKLLDGAEEVEDMNMVEMAGHFR
jgi:hypothetical protein